jgi:hypothetical protein
MNDETVSAQAVGEALPVSGVRPVSPYAAALASDFEASAVAAIERWYAAHFHAAAISGRTPITAEEKASLIAYVTEALTPKE